MTQLWPYTMERIFSGSWLAAYSLSQLQLTLRNPDRLGVRFFWRQLAADSSLWEDDAYRGAPTDERWLHIEWDGESPRPMTEAEEAKLVCRLHNLGFYEVTQARLWDVLAPTLPHDGYGRRDPR